MASEGEIYLGPTGDEELISSFAREVKRVPREIGRVDETADGSLQSDIINKKYTFTIPYEYIDQTALNLLYDRYDLNVAMNLRIYITDVAWFTNFEGNVPSVKMEPFASTDFIVGKTTKLYKGSDLILREV